MIGPSSFLDDIDTDICGDFFDHIDDLLDFSTEDVEGGGGGVIGGDFDGFDIQGSVWPPLPDTLVGSTASDFSGNSNSNGTSELPTELSVPYEDIAQLEWLSNFVEDSFSAGSITLDKDDSSNNNSSNNNDNNVTHQFQTSSPVSVLESSSSCSRGKTMPLSPERIVPGRARSKRPRPPTFNPRPVFPLISPTSSLTETTSSKFPSEFDNFAESSHTSKKPKPVAAEHKKKKKKRLSLPMGGTMEQSGLPQQPISIRKCLHCEITKTPQWRAGPMGPKTLCNACGVRYKSGRLFPEYRPAASPTFVASLHSNSHKKVIEMRTRPDQKTAIAATAIGTTPTQEFVPKISHLLDYI